MLRIHIYSQKSSEMNAEIRVVNTLEVVKRFQAGESMQELAVSLGVSLHLIEWAIRAELLKQPNHI